MARRRRHYRHRRWVVDVGEDEEDVDGDGRHRPPPCPPCRLRWFIDMGEGERMGMLSSYCRCG